MYGLCNKPKPFYLARLSMQYDNKNYINKCSTIVQFKCFK
jgi:hypothetical protein